MAINEEELTASLAEAFGMGPPSEEGLDYARRILHQGLTSPGLPRTGLTAAEEQRDRVIGALEQARQRVQEMEGPSRAEKLFALAAGFGAPTRSGAFGETMANVATQLQPIAAAQRKFESDQAGMLSEFDMLEAQAYGPETELLGELEAIQYAEQQKNMREALKTISRSGAGGSRGTRTREAKIADLMNEWGYTRANASALVDGFIDIQIVPGTGRARLINEITKEVFEVPLASLGGVISDTGDLETSTGSTGGERQPYDPPPTAFVPEGEVDTRTQEEKDIDLWVGNVFREGYTVWDMAEEGTGLTSSVRAGLSVPGALVAGEEGVATETIASRQGLKLRSRDLAQSLVQNPRLPVRQVEMALDAAGIEPELFVEPEMMQSRLVALDQYLYRAYLDFKRYADDPNAPEDLRQDAATNMRLVGAFLRDMGVPLERRRRSVLIPIGDQDEYEGVLPGLDTDRPGSIPRATWDAMTPDEKRRIVELLAIQRGYMEGQDGSE